MIKTLENEVRVLQDQLISLKGIVEFFVDLKGKTTELERLIMDLSDKKDSLVESVAQLTIDNGKLERELADFEVKRNRLDTLLTSNREVENSIKDERATILKEKEEIDSKIADNTAVLAQANHKLNAIELTQKPIYYYVRHLQNVFDDNGLKVDVLEELRKVNK